MQPFTGLSCLSFCVAYPEKKTGAFLDCFSNEKKVRTPN